MEINNKQIISDFVTKNQEKTISFLLKTFSFLKYHDCEDIFQDSMLFFNNKPINEELDNIKLKATNARTSLTRVAEYFMLYATYFVLQNKAKKC